MDESETSLEIDKSHIRLSKQIVVLMHFSHAITEIFLHVQVNYNDIILRD